MPELARAEAHERAGRDRAALADYQRAIERCLSWSRRARRGKPCATAYLARAELLDRTGQRAAAAAAYERMPPELASDPQTRAAALYRSGSIYLELGQDRRGYALLWKTLVDHPDEMYAGDALQRLLQDGRRRDPAALYRVLLQVLAHVASTAAGDNVLHALADLAEHEFGDRHSALAMLDRLATDYPRSGLRDDALWHGARLARSLGDARGAVTRYRKLLASREVSLGAGSYFSVWLDNAQLELGRVLRDALNQPAAALREFQQLAKDYPASLLRDDALWEIARTEVQLGRTAGACHTLRELRRRWPGSRYELSLAPALRRQLGCASSGPER